MDHRPTLWTRRRLLQCGLAAASGGGALRGALGLLAGAGGAAVANGSASDYKALVCVFLYGGNDSFNVLVPDDDAGYAQYAKTRGNLALGRSSLLPVPGTSGPYAFGLHPSVPELQTLQQSGRLAWLANTGTLLTPTTKTDAIAGNNLPPRLFSHNDQQQQCVACDPSASRRVGWGGRLADLLSSINGSNQLSMNISIAGNNTFQTGETTLPYVTGADGIVFQTAIAGGGAAALAAANRAILDDARAGNLFTTYRADLNTQAQSLALRLNSTLASQPPLRTSFPDSLIGGELKMAANLIAARDALGLRRQIFFVTHGTYDMHRDLLLAHPPMLRDLSQALNAFYHATVELGVASAVTTFTSSDFGRCLTSNGRGSDHGWGGNQLIMGDAVIGGQIYGTFPNLGVDGPDDFSSGRVIPSTSLDQYGATLARWFGAADTDLSTIFPHLGRFATANLGFMG